MLTSPPTWILVVFLAAAGVSGAAEGSANGGTATTTPSAAASVAFSAMQNLELDLGAQYGLTPSTMDEDGVAASTVQTVMRGAAKRNPESLYFLGLLRLYGQGGLPEDHEKVTKGAGSTVARANTAQALSNN